MPPPQPAVPTEFPTYATLSLFPTRFKPELGRGFILTTSRIPFAKPPTLKTNSSNDLRVRACPSLLITNLSTTRDPYLLFCFIPGTPSPDPAFHEDQLSHLETSPYELTPLPPVSLRFHWNTDFSYVRTVTCKFPDSALAPLWPILGAPHSSGHWLAHRLLPPRTIGATLSIHNFPANPSPLCHLWIKL